MTRKSSIPEATPFSEHSREQATKGSSQQTVGAILAAARGVLIAHGYAGFTTRRVADAAEISPGNLSYHFPTKRGLLHALIGRLTSDYATQFETLLMDAEIPAGQDLQHLVRWLMDDAVTEEGVHTFRELWAMSLHDPVIRTAVDDLYDKLMATVAELLKRSHPGIDLVVIREVVQYLALMSEGSIVLYGTRRERAVNFERVIDLTIHIIEHLAPDLRADAPSPPSTPTSGPA